MNIEPKHLNYVKNCYPYAQAVYQRFGMNPLVVLAQLSIESAWGESASVQTRRNYAGLTKGSGKPNEFWAGAASPSSVNPHLVFRIYDTPLHSFLDYARLIKEKYANAFSQSNDIQAFAHAIAYSPYLDEKNGDDRAQYQKNIINNANRIAQILTQLQLPIIQQPLTNAPSTAPNPITDHKNNTTSIGGFVVIGASAAALVAILIGLKFTLN